MARTFLLYTGLRLLAFVGCYGVLLVLGVPGLLAIAGALLLSSIVSLLLLRRQRDAFAVALQERRDQRAGEQVRLRALLEDGESDGGPGAAPRR